MAPPLCRLFAQRESQTNAKRIRDALEEVSRVFPFDNYLCDMFAQSFLADLISNFFLPQGGRILDIGGGACDKAAVLTKLGFECEVWDDLRDPWHREGGNLMIIREFAKRMGVVLREVEVGNHTFESGAFDLVMMSDVIEHLHESPRYMLNVGIGAIREGGVVLITTPNSANLRKRLSVLFGGTNYPPALDFFESSGIWRGHVREWTIGETVCLLQWMGLMDIQVKTFHGLLDQSVSSRILRSLYRVCMAPFPSVWDTICAWGKKPSGWGPVKTPKKSAPIFPLRRRLDLNLGSSLTQT